MVFAVAYGQFDVVKYLLERHGNLANARNSAGFTNSDLSTNPVFSYFENESRYALTMASTRGYLDVVSALLHHGARVDNYALPGACRGGYTEIVDLLIDHGADVNQADPHFETQFPLTRAADSGRIEVVELLIRRGATRGLNEALLLYVCRRDFMLTKLLLENGADPNVSKEPLGSTRLMDAVNDYRPDMIRLLLDHGADLRPGESGQTPLIRFTTRCNPVLDYAAHSKASECAEILSAFMEAGYVKDFEIPYHAPFGMIRTLLLGGARNTANSDGYFQQLMRPINMIRSGLAANSIQVISALGTQGLITLGFEARKSGVDVFADSQVLQALNEERTRLVSSIISELVRLDCTDLNFHYTVSPFLAQADEDMLKHAETAFKFLTGSLEITGGMKRYLKTNGAVLNEMIERSSHIGLRPVVKALFAIYHEKSQLQRSFHRLLPDTLTHLVMSHDDFKTTAMQKLIQAIRKHRPLGTS